MKFVLEKVRLGTSLTRSGPTATCSAFRSFWVKAEIATGTFWMSSDRFSAVTTTVSMPAGCCCCCCCWAMAPGIPPANAIAPTPPARVWRRPERPGIEIPSARISSGGRTHIDVNSFHK